MTAGEVRQRQAAWQARRMTPRWVRPNHRTCQLLSIRLDMGALHGSSQEAGCVPGRHSGCRGGDILSTS